MGNAKNVLIVAAAMEGSKRVLKHQNVEKVTLVEIDRAVIALATEYLPFLSNGAFNDKRAHVVIADGAQFVKTTQEKYDVIIAIHPTP